MKQYPNVLLMDNVLLGMTSICNDGLSGGLNVVYHLPEELTPEEFNAKITGYNEKPWQREELQGAPILKGYYPPEFQGYAKLIEDGAEQLLPVIIYRE